MVLFVACITFSQCGVCRVCVDKVGGCRNKTILGDKTRKRAKSAHNGVIHHQLWLKLVQALLISNQSVPDKNLVIKSFAFFGPAGSSKYLMTCVFCFQTACVSSNSSCPFATSISTTRTSVTSLFLVKNSFSCKQGLMLDGERKGREKGTAEGVDVSGAASSRPGFVALFLFPVYILLSC